MTHDDLIVMERHYMSLASRLLLTASEVQLMHFYQTFMRDKKREWESE